MTPMPRRRLEMDLPPLFASHYAAAIDTWLESTKPGDSLAIPLLPGPQVLLSAFVSSAAIERNTVVLRASELPDSVLLIAPADAHSKRLVDDEEGYLRSRREQALVEAVEDALGTFRG